MIAYSLTRTNTKDDPSRGKSDLIGKEEVRPHGQCYNPSTKAPQRTRDHLFQSRLGKNRGPPQMMNG